MDPPKRYIRRLLNIPERYDIIAYVVLGYPQDFIQEVPRKYLKIDELISYNKFEMEREIEKRRLSQPALIALIFFTNIRFNSIKKIFWKILKILKKEDILKVDHE